MEHVLNSDEFMKDKCGGGIKENIMCMKVWENLVEEKLGVVNYAWCVKERKKNRKETHEKKKELKRRKVKRKKNSKAKNVHSVEKIEAWVKMKGKWAKKIIYAHNFIYMLY